MSYFDITACLTFNTVLRKLEVERVNSKNMLITLNNKQSKTKQGNKSLSLRACSKGAPLKQSLTVQKETTYVNSIFSEWPDCWLEREGQRAQSKLVSVHFNRSNNCMLILRVSLERTKQDSMNRHSSLKRAG